MASLSLKNVCKVYPNGFEAVKNFNLEIADQEFIIFVGPSGCGKSTTLRMIAGLEDISSGELRIGDRIVNDVEPKDRDIAMVFQNYALYPHMSVYDNMAFGLKLRKVPKDEIDKMVKEETQKGLQPLMQVTNLKLESNMKEELLEAIYGTVERLEQKVDELSVSTKNAGAENVPASNDITKLDKSINAMFIKEEEVRGKISKLRDAIVVFADLIKVELGKNEQRSKFLVDAVKQMRQGNDVSSKALQEKLEVMNKSPQKKVVTHRFEPTSKNVLLFIGGLALSLVISIWGNLTQWRDYQDWEEADLKYRALKMVLSTDDH